MSRVVLITTCTGRKRIRPSREAHFRQVPRCDAEAAARFWLNRLASLTCTARADKLYSGRGFAEARRAAEMLGAPLKVISAGLGLVDGAAEVPVYEATIAPGSPDTVSSHLNVTSERWWAALKSCQQFDWPTDAQLLLIAASGPYLKMIEPDLLKVPVDRLRLFTRANTGALAAPLRSAVMPYDDRLDARDGRPGTVADFAQRAMAHFAEHVLSCAPVGDLGEHAGLVRSRLSPLTAPVRRVGRKATDEEIMAAIAAHYETVGGQSSQMLRKLRDELGLACEQSRFRNLFRAVVFRQKGEGVECLPL